MPLLILHTLVPTERFELSRLSPPTPQDGVSTNSTTSALLSMQNSQCKMQNCPLRLFKFALCALHSSLRCFRRLLVLFGRRGRLARSRTRRPLRRGGGRNLRRRRAFRSRLRIHHALLVVRPGTREIREPHAGQEKYRRQDRRGAGQKVGRSG